MEEDDEISDDYYAILNLGRDAKVEDVAKAFRTLSKCYHPDRHADPDQKREAEILFRKLRKAHDTLIDPHKRAIYDTVGSKGLEIDGWEVAARQFSAEEIKEEYERLRRLKEEEDLMKSVNPAGVAEVVVNATELFCSSDPDLPPEYDVGPGTSVEIAGMSMSQSVDAPLTQNDRITLNGSLQSINGIGAYDIGLGWTRLVSQVMWTECEAVAGDRLSVSCKLVRTFSKHMFGWIRLNSRIHLDAPSLMEIFEPGIDLSKLFCVLCKERFETRKFIYKAKLDKTNQGLYSMGRFLRRTMPSPWNHSRRNCLAAPSGVLVHSNEMRSLLVSSDP